MNARVSRPLRSSRGTPRSVGRDGPQLTPQAYDAHMNVVLSNVEESIHIVDVNEDGIPQAPRVGLHSP